MYIYCKGLHLETSLGILNILCNCQRMHTLGKCPSPWIQVWIQVDNTFRLMSIADVNMKITIETSEVSKTPKCIYLLDGRASLLEFTWKIRLDVVQPSMA